MTDALVPTTGAEPGLFGPGSVSWRLHADPAMLVGGLRALLLQSLLPGVMHGFAVHSDVRSDPWERLGRTAGYVDTVVFGTRAEAYASAERVRAVHRALGLDDPGWLLWVHCAAVDSWLVGVRASGVRLSETEADAYVAEQALAAELVGCDPATAPYDTTALAACLDSYRPSLRATDEAREAVRGVLWPPMAPRMEWTTPARPLWTWAATTAFGLLPHWARREFRLPGLPTTTLAATISARTLRRGLLLLPQDRRTSPALRAARDRLGLDPTR